jgi:Leucine-rich repeat (LRR) protein
MGAAASISSSRLQALIDRGKQDFAELAIIESLSPNLELLVQLKLGHSALQVLCRHYTSLIEYSKGEDVSDDFRVIECSSEDDIISFFTVEEEATEQTSAVVVAECIGLSSMKSIDEALCTMSQCRSLTGLNISGNQCTDSTFSSSRLLATTTDLSYLHLGGNKIIYPTSLLRNLSNCNILILDLSYTETLRLSAFDFLYIPQLKRLVLDGCNLESTSCRASVDTEEEISIFWGLVELQELSLRENQLSSIQSLSGLTFFNFSSIDTATIPSGVTYLLPPTLLQLWISSNPCCDTTSGSMEVNELMKMLIPSLLTIDGRAVQEATTTRKIDLSKVLKREVVGSSSSVTGSGMAFENLEKEYLAALKNEKDSTVVS